MLFHTPSLWSPRPGIERSPVALMLSRGMCSLPGGRTVFFLGKITDSFSCQCPTEGFLQRSSFPSEVNLAPSMPLYILHLDYPFCPLGWILWTCSLLFKNQFFSPNRLSRVTFLGVPTQPLMPTYHFCKTVLWFLVVSDPFYYRVHYSSCFFQRNPQQQKPTPAVKGSSKHVFSWCLLKSRQHITYTQIIQTPYPVPFQKKWCSGPPCLDLNFL